MSDAVYYKFLDESGGSPHGYFDYSDYLPGNNKPGKWLPPIEGRLVQCEKGYHIVTANQLLDWVGQKLYQVEVDGEIECWDNKCGCRRFRLVREVAEWNEITLRLFAADCAESVLPLFENQFSNDPRPRNAVNAARAFAQGKINTEQLEAARAAAWAARDASWAAARAAASAASWAVSRDASWAVSRDAARAAEAAASAAEAATSAAEAATSAAGAATSATGVAERDFQNVLLCQYLNLEIPEVLNGEI